MQMRFGRWSLVVASVLVLIAPLAIAVGTGGTGVMAYVRGALTRSPAITVSGVTFDTSEAAITINGETHGSDDLLPGMVAGITGRVNPGQQTGVAQTIDVTRMVFGQAIRVGTGGTGVMAVGVYVVPRTDVVFAGFDSLDQLASGDTIDVYGYSDGLSGNIQATRIERTAPGSFVELRGIVTSLTGTTFVLQGVTVDYSAAQLVGFTSALAVGDWVSARGTAGSQGIAAATVTAEPPDYAKNGAEAEVEDAISAIIAPSVFVVDDYEVDATNATFTGGTAADLALGRVVHVEGKFVDGVVKAKSVEFDDEASDDSTEASGGDDSTEASGGADVDGSITAVNSPTSFVVGHTNVDASNATFVNGQASDVAVGREVHAVGTRDSSKTLHASRVTFVTKGSTDGPANGKIEGKVATVSAPGVFVVRSTTIDARNATIRGGSLAKVRVGTEIQAVGAFQGGVFVATKLAFDD